MPGPESKINPSTGKKLKSAILKGAGISSSTAQSDKLGCRLYSRRDGYGNHAWMAGAIRKAILSIRKHFAPGVGGRTRRSKIDSSVKGRSDGTVCAVSAAWGSRLHALPIS